jgi:hypothetical protein
MINEVINNSELETNSTVSALIKDKDKFKYDLLVLAGFLVFSILCFYLFIPIKEYERRIGFQVSYFPFKIIFELAVGSLCFLLIFFRNISRNTIFTTIVTDLLNFIYFEFVVVTVFMFFINSLQF